MQLCPAYLIGYLSFKGRQFIAEVILWAVGWYLMFPISYRDLELMLLDRGVEVDHTTLFRWIQGSVRARAKIVGMSNMLTDAAIVRSCCAAPSPTHASKFQNWLRWRQS